MRGRKGREEISETRGNSNCNERSTEHVTFNVCKLELVKDSSEVILSSFRDSRTKFHLTTFHCLSYQNVVLWIILDGDLSEHVLPKYFDYSRSISIFLYIYITFLTTYNIFLFVGLCTKRGRKKK